MWCIFNTEQCFILKVLTGNYVSISGSRALSLSLALSRQIRRLRLRSEKQHRILWWKTVS